MSSGRGSSRPPRSRCCGCCTHPMSTPEIHDAAPPVQVQLTDPLYRTFSGTFLPERPETIRPSVRRQAAIDWVAELDPPRWALKTQIRFATRLLSCSLGAGLLGGNRDPRDAVTPRVPDEVLSYLPALRWSRSDVAANGHD